MRNFQLLGSGIGSKRIGQQCHLVKIAVSAESILRRFPVAILLIGNEAGGEEKDGIGPVLKINNHATGGWRPKDILGGPKGWGPKKKGRQRRNLRDF